MVGKLPGGHTDMESLLTGCGGGPIVTGVSVLPAGTITHTTKKLYVLVMVDPDAKSRTNPEFAYWRHWLVADIQGTSLAKGQIGGTTLTDYRPPTPPSKSGFHRYQFMLFEQPADAQVTLTEAETSSRGKWDVDAFLKRVGLGAPVATLQYLTQNYKD
ncbi:hypothetical protein WMY93_005054 [Mugilogobius chulae]|uniref:Phosphatidylethanolamine-binding protein 4 n=1 Tax=Mugilogobius chulae TaxID=88201 RepID=A0AAW0PTX1_9GOBI